MVPMSSAPPPSTPTQPQSPFLEIPTSIIEKMLDYRVNPMYKAVRLVKFDNAGAGAGPEAYNDNSGSFVSNEIKKNYNF